MTDAVYAYARFVRSLSKIAVTLHNAGFKSSDRDAIIREVPCLGDKDYDLLIEFVQLEEVESL